MSAIPRSLRNLVVKNGYGQLGNRLYRLGNLMAFALEHRLDVYDFALKDRGYATFFENTRHSEYLYFAGGEPNASIPASAAEMLQILDEDSALLFNDEDELVLDVGELRDMERETVYFEGFHFQADELTPKYHDRIAAFFQPERETRERVDLSFGRLRGEIDCVVGVHLRQGDFQQWDDGQYFFTAEEFAARCRELLALVEGQRTVVLVFSDESVNKAAFEGLPAYFSSGTIIEDLYSLSRCDYILAPPRSTFSGWSSYFGRVPMARMDRSERPLQLADFQVNRILNNV